jgi:hypothetical protein
MAPPDTSFSHCWFAFFLDLCLLAHLAFSYFSLHVLQQPKTYAFNTALFDLEKCIDFDEPSPFHESTLLACLTKNTPCANLSIQYFKKITTI